MAMFIPRTMDDMQHPKIIPIRHPWKPVRAIKRVTVLANHWKAQTKFRMTGSVQKTTTPLHARHLTAQLWRVTVDVDDALDAVDDLLARGSNNFRVSEPSCPDGLNF
jgi:hypothetical protein